LRGVAVAELEGIEARDVLLNVALVDGGEVVAERPLTVRFVENAVSVVAVVTRNCRTVRCPGMACVDGRCVDPGCSPDDIEACGDARCSADAQCRAEGPCREGRCLEGLCLAAPTAECVLDAGTPDAGRPDAGRPDAGPGCVATDAGPPVDAGSVTDGGLRVVSCRDPVPRCSDELPLHCDYRSLSGCEHAPCADPWEYRTSTGDCARAAEACCLGEACAFNHGVDLPSGHFLRHYIWGFGTCAGDCCWRCWQLQGMGEPVPGAERCRSGRARCIETVPRGESYLSAGYCECE